MELANGAIDGVNRTFTTTYVYQGGTVRAFTPLLRFEVSVAEQGANIVELAVAPKAGSLVYLAYQAI